MLLKETLKYIFISIKKDVIYIHVHICIQIFIIITYSWDTLYLSLSLSRYFNVTFIFDLFYSKFSAVFFHDASLNHPALRFFIIFKGSLLYSENNLHGRHVTNARSKGSTSYLTQRVSILIDVTRYRSVALSHPERDNKTETSSDYLIKLKRARSGRK